MDGHHYAPSIIYAKLSIQNHGLNLINVLKLTIRGQQRSTGLHTAGGNPNNDINTKPHIPFTILLF